jgi:hypothetical protein
MVVKVVVALVEKMRKAKRSDEIDFVAMSVVDRWLLVCLVVQISLSSTSEFSRSS